MTMFTPKPSNGRPQLLEMGGQKQECTGAAHHSQGGKLGSKE